MINPAEYARALFLLAEERGTAESILADIRVATLATEENPKYSSLADTPALTKAERLALVSEAFASLDTDLLSLIKILVERHSFSALSKIRDEFSRLYDEARNIERVVAISAIPLSEEQSVALTKKLETLTKKTVILENKVDPSILGGVVLRYSGTQLDDSLKTRLDKLTESLKSIII